MTKNFIYLDKFFNKKSAFFHNNNYYQLINKLIKKTKFIMEITEKRESYKTFELKSQNDSKSKKY